MSLAFGWCWLSCCSFPRVVSYLSVVGVISLVVDRRVLQQSEGVLREGEVAGSEEESEEKLVVCQRCHKLRFYGSVEENLRPGFSDSDLLTPKRFLVRRAQAKCRRYSCITVACAFCC